MAVDKVYCDHVAQIANGNAPGRYLSWELVERCIEEGIPGDFVECGVFAGAHPIIMSIALKQYPDEKGKRNIHLFDSFQGIPKAHEDAHPANKKSLGVAPEGVMESSGISNCSLESVQGYVNHFGGDPDRMVFHPGWFQDTLHKVEPFDIAYLRIDADLGESWRHICANLYPMVVKGGFVVADDFGNPYCQQAFEEFHYEAYPDEPLPAMTALEGDSGTFWWRKEY